MTQRTLELLVLALVALAAVVVAITVFRWSRSEDRRLEDLRSSRSGAITATRATVLCSRCLRRRATGRDGHCDVCREVEGSIALAVDRYGDPYADEFAEQGGPRA